MIKKKVFYVYRTARKQNFINVSNNLEPDHILYGYNYIRKSGYSVSFSDIAYSKFNLLFWLFLPIQKLFIKYTSVGFKFDQALLLLPYFYCSDIIITTTDSAGLPLLLLKKLRVLNKPVIYISTGLINELSDRNNEVVAFYKSLLQYVDILICHSNIEKKSYLKYIPILKDKISVIPFGIDQKFFKKTTVQKKYILSIGRDKSRDYNFLSKVALRIKSENFLVVTSRSNIKGVTFPRNVKIMYDLPYDQVRDIYLKAKLVFLPLKEINRASGQIAFLEALSSNNKVVISNIRGIKDVYKKLLNIKNTVVYKPDDVESAVESLVKALKIKEHRFEMPSDFTSLKYAERIDSIIKKI